MIDGKCFYSVSDTLECDEYNQFSCGGSVCLPSTALCDGVMSCGSGEDENDCTGILIACMYVYTCAMI